VGAKDSEVLKKRKKLSNDEHLATITSAVAKAIYAQNEAIIAKQAELAIQQIQLTKQQDAVNQKQTVDQNIAKTPSSLGNTKFQNRPVLKWVSSWFYPTASIPESKVEVNPSHLQETSRSVSSSLDEEEEEEDTASIAAALIDKEHL
jgi:hypothetical protein